MEPEGSLPHSQIQFWVFIIIITPDNTDLSFWISHYEWKVAMIFRNQNLELRLEITGKCIKFQEIFIYLYLQCL